MARLTRFLWKTIARRRARRRQRGVGWAFQSRTMLPLEVWHTAALDGEFTAADAKDQPTLKDYLAREDALFRELDAEVYRHVERNRRNDVQPLSLRQHAGSFGPATRTGTARFELLPEGEVRGGVLLLHGSDRFAVQPAARRRDLPRKGFYVLGTPVARPRNHSRRIERASAGPIGSPPATSARVTFVSASAPTLPFFLAGYSNGGGLSVKYALDARSTRIFRFRTGLLLFSPEIGIASVAVISNIGKVLTYLPYFAQFRWLSIEPEYDPYKYNSFPKNAADQAWNVTQAVQNGLTKARSSGTDEPISAAC